MDDSTRYTPYAPTSAPVRARRPLRTRDAERWDEALRLLAEDLAALGTPSPVRECKRDENGEAAP
jgi:hypothetical protein